MKIIINGKTREVTKSALSHEDLCEMVGESNSADVNFRYAAADPVAALLPIHEVALRDGMIFDVVGPGILI